MCFEIWSWLRKAAVSGTHANTSQRLDILLSLIFISICYFQFSVARWLIGWVVKSDPSFNHRNFKLKKKYIVESYKYILIERPWPVCSFLYFEYIPACNNILHYNICYLFPVFLTHWGQVTHISVSKLAIIRSNNGLLPGRSQAIIWIIAGILLIQILGPNLSRILSETHAFLFKKMHLKMLSTKWWAFCLCFNVLNLCVLRATDWWCYFCMPSNGESNFCH